MKIFGLFLGSILIGAFVIGAWIYLGGSSTPQLLQEPELTRDRSKIRYAPYVVLVPAEPQTVAPETPALPKAPPRQTSEPAPLSEPVKTVANAPNEPMVPPPAIARSESSEPVPVSSDVARQALDAVLSDDKNRIRETPQIAEEPKKEQTETPPTRPSLIADVAPAEQSVAPVIAQTPGSTPQLAPPLPERKSKPETPAPDPVVVAVPPSPDTVASPAPPSASPPAPSAAATSAPAAQQVVRKEPSTKLKYEVETNRQAKEAEKKQSLLEQGTVRFRRVIPIGPGHIKAGENIIQLAGVVPLDADAQCNYTAGGTWDCGKSGTYALRRFIRSRSVVCKVIDEISPTQVTGRCTVGGSDISKWIVRRGWGVPTSETRSDFSGDLIAAQNAKVGQWRESASDS